ncbi:MAG TPA: hypothetical protein VFR78_21980 [Pyrinomonadaceae bacterium]|nr:hypothetical protein [Pyrinomonadaceae bacterium]
MDSKKEGTRGSAATGSKMAAASKKQQSTGDTGTSGQSGQGATGQQGQGQGQGGEQDLVQHAKEATGEIVNQVQQQAGQQIDRQKESAANDLSQVVNAVRRFGESLAQEQGGPIARYAAQYGDKAAQKLEQFAGYIREQDARRLLDDVQNFGRRRPALMLGGAFLLGLAGARLIRSSIDAGMQHSGGQQSFNTNRSRTNVTTPPTVTGSNITNAPSSPTQGAI